MYIEQQKRICKVLLAEDNPDDITIFKRVVRKKQDRFQLQVVMDGEAALEFLRKEGSWHNARTPDLVVLNLNMPNLNGWGVLKAMKEDPALRILPIAIWSITEREEDIKRAFEASCSGMFTKPVDMKDAMDQVGAMLEYHWWSQRYPY